MNPTPQPMPQTPMTDAAQPTPQIDPNAVFEEVRKALMMLVQLGIPGMDKVLHALNKVHVDMQAQNSGAQTPQLGPTPQATPQNPTPSGYYGG